MSDVTQFNTASPYQYKNGEPVDQLSLAIINMSEEIVTDNAKIRTILFM